MKPSVCPWSSMFISYLDDGVESIPVTSVSTADTLEDKMILKVRNIVQEKMRTGRDWCKINHLDKNNQLQQDKTENSLLNSR